MHSISPHLQQVHQPWSLAVACSILNPVSLLVTEQPSYSSRPPSILYCVVTTSSCQCARSHYFKFSMCTSHAAGGPAAVIALVSSSRTSGATLSSSDTSVLMRHSHCSQRHQDHGTKSTGLQLQQAKQGEGLRSGCMYAQQQRRGGSGRVAHTHSSCNAPASATVPAAGDISLLGVMKIPAAEAALMVLCPATLGLLCGWPLPV